MSMKDEVAGLTASLKTKREDRLRERRNVTQRTAPTDLMMLAAQLGNPTATANVAALQARVSVSEAELAAWSDAIPVRKLDPKLVHRSRWANRSEAEFSTPEFVALKAEIADAGGNVQPILVRVLVGPTPSDRGTNEGVLVGPTPDVVAYEVVYGHRRHQACAELGLPVLAQVVTHLDDQALFVSMDRENRARKDLSPYDQGRMYAAALDWGMYPSLRRLAESVGVDLGNASRFVLLARLPQAVIEAFPSPLDLTYRWAKPLTDAVEKDPAGVIARAKDAKAQQLDANAVFNLLLGKNAAPAPKTDLIAIKGKKAASVRIGAKGRALIEFEPGALTTEQAAGLGKLIRDYLSRH